MNKKVQYSKLKKEIGEAIVKRRLELGLDREKLAETLGLGFSTVKRIEEASNNYTIDNLLQITEALECDISYIFNDFYENSEIRLGKVIEQGSKKISVKRSPFSEDIVVTSLTDEPIEKVIDAKGIIADFRTHAGGKDVTIYKESVKEGLQVVIGRTKIKVLTN